MPPALEAQLRDGGRLVMPVGADPRTQVLLRLRRRGDRSERDNLGDVRFVPLIGAEGWSEAEDGPDAPAGGSTLATRWARLRGRGPEPGTER